jgi:hypothetical protein
VRSRHTFSSRRRQARQEALGDALVRPLLKRLLVGPNDPAFHRHVVSAARLMLLGLDILTEVAASAQIPPTCSLDRSNGLRSYRPGDRILWNREVVWTELTDGAAWETELFLEADYMAELKADLHRLTAAGLTAEGKSEIFMLLEDLPPEKRPRLLEATARPARNVPPAEIDRDFLDASARQLRDLARSFDPEGKE